MSATVLTNARLIDPASGREAPGAVLVQDGLVADVAWGAQAEPPEGATVLDCGGHILAPGLVDMRAFVGEPGAEHRETLKTASEAAAGTTGLMSRHDVVRPPSARISTSAAYPRACASRASSNSSPRTSSPRSSPSPT